MELPTTHNPINATTNSMIQSGKASAIVNIINTDSNLVDHSNIKNDLVAHVHTKLSKIAAHEIPVETIRAFWKKHAGNYTIRRVLVRGWRAAWVGSVGGR